MEGVTARALREQGRHPLGLRCYFRNLLPVTGNQRRPGALEALMRLLGAAEAGSAEAAASFPLWRSSCCLTASDPGPVLRRPPPGKPAPGPRGGSDRGFSPVVPDGASVTAGPCGGGGALRQPGYPSAASRASALPPGRPR